MLTAFIAGLIVGAMIATGGIFLWCAFANGNGLDQDLPAADVAPARVIDMPGIGPVTRIPSEGHWPDVAVKGER